MAVVCATLRLILVVYQVRYDVGLANIDQEAITNNNGALQLRKSSVSFAEVADFVLTV